MSHEQSTIIKDEELVLKSDALQGAGSVNGTGIGMGPTAGVKAVIVVSVVAAGGTLDVHLEESDVLGSGYADIANSAFSQILAAGIYEQEFRASKKYVRYVGTVGVNDVTWQMLVCPRDL